jgi:TetR/AcrR family acrAB operon transcriptional repressor
VSATGAARGRKSAEHAQATRAALVELAGQLFAERGYIQTSVRDIARHARCTSGAIYGHFRNKADLLAAVVSVGIAEDLEGADVGLDRRDHVETLTRHAREAASRRGLRALLVQGAAAAQTDDETRTSLREEQLSHVRRWIEGYERERERLGIDPAVDVPTAVLYTWAVELGLGVLEGFGIEPTSPEAWADVQNRLARGLQLPPDDPAARPPARPRAPRRAATARASRRTG